MANTAIETFISNLAQALGTSKKEAKKNSDLVFQNVIKTLNEFGSLRLNDFGKFEVKEMRERKIRNIHTGKDLTIPPRNTPKFTPSQNFKDQVNGASSLKKAV